MQLNIESQNGGIRLIGEPEVLENVPLRITGEVFEVNLFNMRYDPNAVIGSNFARYVTVVRSMQLIEDSNPKADWVQSSEYDTRKEAFAAAEFLHRALESNLVRSEQKLWAITVAGIDKDGDLDYQAHFYV